MIKAREAKKTKIKENRVFNAFNILLMSVLTLFIAYPMWNLVVSTFSSAQYLAEGSITFYPKGFTLENYQAVLRDASLAKAFGVSVAKSLLGIVTHVSFCAMVAFGMSKKELAGRKIYTALGIVTMFFSGGMVPTFLLYRELGLLNSFAVYIIPAMFSYFDMVIMMNFFRDLPPSLEESALIDGAGVWKVFLQIVIPLSVPVIATIALFTGVGQWNDFMTARMFVSNKELHPLQMKLFEIIVRSQVSAMTNPAAGAVEQVTTRSIQLATIVLTTLPIVMIYPFVQKYFVKGMTLGAVKG